MHSASQLCPNLRNHLCRQILQAATAHCCLLLCCTDVAVGKLDLLKISQTRKGSASISNLSNSLMDLSRRCAKVLVCASAASTLFYGKSSIQIFAAFPALVPPKCPNCQSRKFHGVTGAGTSGHGLRGGAAKAWGVWGHDGHHAGELSKRMQGGSLHRAKCKTSAHVLGCCLRHCTHCRISLVVRMRSRSSRRQSTKSSVWRTLNFSVRL